MKAWLGFQLAAEIVERERGVNWGAAQKALLDACNAGQIRFRNRDSGGPDVRDDDLQSWLKARPRGGKVPRIIRHLAELHPNGVPDPGLAPRKALIVELIRRDPTLGPTLDEATVKKAIDEYNSGNSPVRIVSD
jgi:hypothetical protein